MKKSIVLLSALLISGAVLSAGSAKASSVKKWVGKTFSGVKSGKPYELGITFKKTKEFKKWVKEDKQNPFVYIDVVTQLPIESNKLPRDYERDHYVKPTESHGQYTTLELPVPLTYKPKHVPIEAFLNATPEDLETIGANFAVRALFEWRESGVGKKFFHCERQVVSRSEGLSGKFAGIENGDHLWLPVAKWYDAKEHPPSARLVLDFLMEGGKPKCAIHWANNGPEEEGALTKFNNFHNEVLVSAHGKTMGKYLTEEREKRLLK